jgi:RNA polymerase primary sigma factor
MKAAGNFDPSYGHRFMSYAPIWVRQTIARSVADNARTIRIPVHMVQTIDQLNNVSRRLTQEYGREPTSEEIGIEMELKTERVREIIKIAQLPSSLDEPIGKEQHAPLADFIEDTNNAAPVDAVSNQQLKEELVETLSELSPREQRVLVLRFGLEDGRSRTLEEVGQEFKVTRERIRQIEEKALRRLRHPRRSRRLRGYL